LIYQRKKEMNIISKALNEVSYRIPKEILKEAFYERAVHWRDRPISIEEQITNKVIRPRVLTDCNLVGGTEAFIPLEGLEAEIIDNFTSVYRVSKDSTQGRSIMSVLSVSFTTQSIASAAGALSGIKPGSVTDTGLAGMAMMDSFSSIPITSTARVSLIGENTIMIRDTAPIISYGYIRCILGNDENLANMQMRTIPDFCRLVELAVKSFIYNEMIIKIGMAQLSGGQDLGKFKEIVESYADSEEMYTEFLRTVWAKVSLFNDTQSSTRLLKLMIGGMR
jgi:hypothetical protein